MKLNLTAGLLLAAFTALVLPPFLLMPMLYHLPKAQLFKDFYEACLWLTPATGIVVLSYLYRMHRHGRINWRQPAIITTVILAGLDLVAPLFFYLLLAILAGH